MLPTNDGCALALSGWHGIRNCVLTLSRCMHQSTTAYTAYTLRSPSSLNTRLLNSSSFLDTLMSTRRSSNSRMKPPRIFLLTWQAAGQGSSRAGQPGGMTCLCKGVDGSACILDV